MSGRTAYLGIDAGGTLVKAALFDEYGQAMGIGTTPVSTLTPQPRHAERDMDDLWRGVVGAIRAALAAAPSDLDDIVAVGVTGFGNGLFLLDRDGRPVHPAILSTDSRAFEIVKDWQARGLEQAVREATWQGVWTGKPLPLLAWLARNRPHVIDRAATITCCKDYIRYRLTGRLVNELTDLSSASLIDGATALPPAEAWRPLDMAWAADLLPADPLQPQEIAGEITAAIAAETGLQAGTPVVAGAADVVVAHLGSGVVDLQTVGIIAGTWSINQRLTAGPVVTDGSRFATTMTHDPETHLAIEASPTSAGNLAWFVRTLMARDQVDADRDDVSIYEICNREVADATTDQRSPVFIPQVNGAFEAGRARGAFVGLESWHRRGDLLRAIYEGIACEHRLHVERLVGDGTWPDLVRLSGGAARSKEWVRIFADVLEAAVEVPQGTELGALGLAILAAVGTGRVASVDVAVASMTAVDCRVERGSGAVPAPEQRMEQYRRVKDATLSIAMASDG